jgi:hypothetical protein
MKRLWILVGWLAASLGHGAWIELDPSLETGVRVLEERADGLRLECTVAGYDEQELKIDGQSWWQLRLPGEAWLLEAGAPEVPVLARSLRMPDQGSARLEVVDRETRRIERALAPSKGNLSRAVDPAGVPWEFGPAYREAVWPAEPAELRDPYILRDHRGLTVLFQPLRALPLEGAAEISTRLVIDVFWDEAPGLNELPARSAPERVDEDFAALYRLRFLNMDTTERYTPLEEAGRLLVICHDAFLGELEPFVEWKRQSGREVEIRPLSEVGATPAAIQAFVAAYYASPGLSHLLLVGDAEQLPSLSAAGGASDPGYGMLAGSDYYPDIFVGRFSGSTTAQIATQVERCVAYERDPQPGAAWYARAMGVASDEGAGIGDDGESDIQHLDNIRTDLLGYGYTLVDRIYEPSATAAQVTAAVNEGRSFVNYTGHGSVTSWGTTGFSNTHINALVNHHRLPVIIDVACVNGQFAGTTCFAEAWMRATDNGQPTGAVGIYASTINQSWAPPMAAQDECTDLLVAEAKLSFGGICFNGAMLMNDEYADYDMTRTWTIFTDPSLQLRTRAPLPLSVSHPGSLFSTAPSLAVQTGVEGSRVTLYADGLIYGSALAGPAGLAQVPLEHAPTVGTTLTLTVVGHNRETYQGLVEVLPPEGPYVALQGTLLDGDGELNPSEQTWLSLQLANLGVEDALELSFSLSCDHPGIGAIAGNPDLALLPAGAETTLAQAFELTSTAALEDGASVPLTLLVQSAAGGSWESPFSLLARAPRLTLQEVVVIDGGNGRLDPGESAVLELRILNEGGQASGTLSAQLACADGFVAIDEAWDTLPALAPGASALLTYSVTVDGATPDGHLLPFVLAGPGLEAGFALRVGLTLEDFESGDFSQFPWQAGGNAPWSVQGATVHEGLWAARSGPIGHNQSSVLELSVHVLQAGELSFWYRVSSEANYDYFRFHLDGVQQLQASGEVGWTQAVLPLAAGERLLRFSYNKDASVVGGSDCAWLDSIILPAIGAPPAPAILVEPEALSFFALPGQQDTGLLQIRNTGSAELSWSLAFQPQAPRPGGGAGRSVEGSSLSFDESEFLPGAPATFHVQLTNASPDNEWLSAASLDFPPGVTVTGFSDLAVPAGRRLTADGSTGDGALIAWLDADGGWGNIYPGETATGSIEVEIAAGFSGDMLLEWTIDGDVYGGAPHSISGSFSLGNAGGEPSWLLPDLWAGSLAPGALAEVTLLADAALLEAGLHAGTLQVQHNDPARPPLTLPISFQVGGDMPSPLLQIHYLGNCSSRLEWEALPGAQRYRILQAASLAGPWNLIAETEECLWLVPCGVGGTFLYKVVAVW